MFLVSCDDGTVMPDAAASPGAPAKETCDALKPAIARTKTRAGRGRIEAGRVFRTKKTNGGTNDTRPGTDYSVR
jgi:hypothetical protein